MADSEPIDIEDAETNDSIEVSRVSQKKKKEANISGLDPVCKNYTTNWSCKSKL